MNGDELILRIVPELDQNAKKQVEDDLNTITGNIPIGGKGKGDNLVKESDELNKSIRTRIDLIDLESRKTQAASLDRVKALQTQAAQGRLAQGELIAGIEREETVRSRATQLAIRDYEAVQRQISETTILTEKQSVALERKLLFATERAKTGLVSASRSMEGLASNTKDANIAFANFGRIVQDAPFGLLGISNNIDPLLNSFSQLKASTGGAGAALAAMGRQLLGPAGLIFLLGSALPTALLFAQKYFKDMKKEVDETNDSINTIIEQFARLAAQAAEDRGVPQLTAELAVARDILAQQRREEAKYIEQAKGGRSELNEQLLATVRSEIEVTEATIKRYEQSLLNLGIEKTIENLKRSGALGEALRIQQAIEDEKKLSDARRKAEEERNRLLLQQFSELEPLLALQLTFNDAIMESRNAYLAQAQAAMVAQRAEQAAFDAKVRRESARGRDTSLTGEESFAYEREMAQQEALAKIRIDTLRASGMEEQAIIAETEQAKRNEKLRLLSLGITDAETINNALAVISKEGADRIKDNELTVADARSESMAIYADAVASGLGAIFGENKAIQSAQVVVDTYAGAQKAFAALAPNLPLQIAASGAVIAQGIATLRKINSTQKGTKSIGRTASQASPTPSGPQFVNDLGVAGQVAGTITPFGASMSPSISITANLDRQGLALAVRDGEADIATRQIPFAS
jgi:hypothetical protein